MIHARTCAALALSFTAALAPSAIANERFRDKRAAAQAGDPSASAPVAKMSSKFKYKGKDIPSVDAAADGLVCNEVAGQPTRCYDTATQAEASMGASSQQHARATKVRGARLKARAAQHCDPGGPLRTYDRWYQTTTGGWGLNLYSRHDWYDMQPGYDNDTSSYGMNAHSGHLSDYAGGGGYWYPGDTGVCGYNDTMSGGSSSWDNRISSRYRN